jgi:hypothetical protein
MLTGSGVCVGVKTGLVGGNGVRRVAVTSGWVVFTGVLTGTVGLQAENTIPMNSRIKKKTIRDMRLTG